MIESEKKNNRKKVNQIKCVNYNPLYLSMDFFGCYWKKKLPLTLLSPFIPLSNALGVYFALVFSKKKLRIIRFLCRLIMNKANVKKLWAIISVERKRLSFLIDTIDG